MKVLGLMSGTSLDGVDVALMEIDEASEGESAEGRFPDLRWELLAFTTRAFGSEEREAIRGAIEEGTPRTLALIHAQLGEWFAAAVSDLLDAEAIPAADVRAIGSHGQTIWHEPPRPGHRGVSLQLGCSATLAERTGIGVVSDFRSKDLASGGQGAPLVPWADRLLFSSPEGPRAIQNLGGMANVTWLPTVGSGDPILAFDTGPGVALLNIATEWASEGRMSYDEGGRLAAGGQVALGALEEALAHPFFREPPPRSTGREVFGPPLVEALAETVARESGEEMVPGRLDHGWPHLLATLVALTARSLGDAYRKWVVPNGVQDVFLTGGGARNPALVKAIAAELDGLAVRPGHDLGLDPDAREAAAFALLAWAHLRGVPANVPEATGARGPRVLGSWTPV